LTAIYFFRIFYSRTGIRIEGGEDHIPTVWIRLFTLVLTSCPFVRARVGHRYRR
jgi:hypothetical protein